MKFAPFRSATAAKIFAAHNAAQMPNFFMSTPQFKRQRSQLAHYSETAKTYGLDPGPLGTPTYAVPFGQNSDEDDKERRKVRISARDPHSEALEPSKDLQGSQAPIAEGSAEGADGGVAGELEAQDSDEQATLPLILTLRSLQERGNHTQVLECLAELEAEGELPPEAEAEAYTIALASLAELSVSSLDAAPLLEAFQRIVLTSPDPAQIAQAVRLTVSSLVRIARQLRERRAHLIALLGTTLETVKDILASVDPADPLRLALEIARGSSDPAVVGEAVAECRKEGLDVGEVHMGKGVPSPQESLGNGKASAGSSSLEDLFAQKKYNEALALDDPPTLAGSLLFARHGFPALAARRSPPCSELLEAVCATGLLSTSSLLYDRLVAQPVPALSPGRNAYLRLCATEQDTEMLLKGIKESQLRRAVWDPTTLLVVCGSLLETQPQLATELFVVQTQRLEALWDSNELKTLAGEELVAEFLAMLGKHEGSPGSPSTRSSLILCQSPTVCAAPSARQAIFRTVLDAREAASPEYLELMSEHPEALSAIVDAISAYVVGASSPVGLALPFDVQSALHRAYPLLVSDLVDNQLAPRDAGRVQRSLELLRLGTQPWIEFAQKVVAVPSNELANSEIMAYASTPNGLDTALELAERQFLVRCAPSAAAMRTLVAEAHGPRLQRLISLVETQFGALDLPTRLAYLRAFCRCDSPFAVECYHRLRGHNALPCSAGFVALISAANNQFGQCLFDEARAAGVATAAVWEAALASAARVEDTPRVRFLASQITPSNATHALLLGYFIEHNLEAEALGVVDSMLQLRLGYEQTTEPWNMLLEFYVYTQQNRDAALKVLEYTRQAGVTLSPLSYKLLIDTWLLQPMDLENAENVLLNMEGTPNTQHFSTVLRAHGVLDRNLDSARAFYRGLVKNARVMPDQHIFAALVASYVANGRSSDLPLVLDEMAKFRVPRQSVAEELSAFK